MMRKNFFIMIVFYCLTSPVISGDVYANDELRPFEETYSEIGFQSVNEALKAFEDHFKKNVKLPIRVPPVTFTHVFGRFGDLEGEENDAFEVKFINDKVPGNHYKINIRPIKYKIPLKARYVINTYALKNDMEATYMTFSGFNALVFEQDNWQYMLSIDEKLSDRVTPETLVQIANSIDYSNERK